jgi:hypothetical protein
VRTICWRLSAWDPDIASVRYRAVIPALHLAQKGVASRFSGVPYGVLEPDPPDAVVFVKAFGDCDVELAREAANAGVPVMIDVCDNVFAAGYRAQSSANLRRMAELATAVVVTGPALFDVLRRELSDSVPVHVVPDPLETPADVRDAARRVWQQRLVRSFRERPSDIPRAIALAIVRGGVPALRRRVPSGGDGGLPDVLWFGNAGSVEPRFGIINVADIAGELEAAAREVPFRLVVVTGDRGAYRKHVEPLALETAFEPWDRLTIFRRVRRSAVVIVPNSRDEFSVCKSANRPVLALSQDVPVVATRIPSLEPLDGAVLFDDFQAGVVAYLSDRALAAEHIRGAREVIEGTFAPTRVAAAWHGVLESVWSREHAQ